MSSEELTKCKVCNLPILLIGGQPPKLLTPDGRHNHVHWRPTIPNIKKYCERCNDYYSIKNPCEHHLPAREAFQRFDEKRKKKDPFNRRMKNTKCSFCNKDLNGYSYEKMIEHANKHLGQSKILSFK